MIKEIYPKEAQEILEQQNQAVLIDVRSTMEFEYVGHPTNAVHVPIKEPPAWGIDEDFVNNVKSAIQQHSSENELALGMPLLMLCRSGARSALAAEMLIKEGYTNVYNILDGFEGDKDESSHRNTINGWRFHDLPWEQS